MNERFRQHVESLDPTFSALIAMVPTHIPELPRDVPARGVYLLSEGDDHLYAGRSNTIRKRLQAHCRRSSTHNSASFAFRIARQKTGNIQASYSKSGSRDELERDPVFREAFQYAKERIRRMDVRYAEEEDPMRQALLEMYVALSLGAKYNDFDNH